MVYSLQMQIDQQELLRIFIKNTSKRYDTYPDENIAYASDIIALIYYYRQYKKDLDLFIEENKGLMSDYKISWAKYEWKSLNAKTEEEISDLVLELLSEWL